MSACDSIELHVGESWLITFLSRAFDNTVLPMPIGSSVEFRLSDQAGTALSVSTDNAITITDRNAGAGTILITPEMQTTANITPRKSYKFELRVETPSVVSVQAEGKFTVLPSLFVN